MTVTDVGWEARMAARAAARAEIAREREHREAMARLAETYREFRDAGLRLQAHMTLGRAVDLLRAPPHWCACVGPPGCCRYGYEQAAALQRGAHIMAKALADVAARSEPAEREVLGQPGEQQ